MRWRVLMVVAFVADAGTAWADVRVPSLFGSHMVLQREQENPVWGWAEPGEEVTVQIGPQSQTTRAGADGRWRVKLAPMAAGGPYVLKIRGQNELELEDVWVGEVWICSGQSNMQWPVNLADDPDLEKMTANYPQIRLLTVPNVGTQEPQEDFRGQWQVCSPETVGSFSAIGYFFGRLIHQATGMPVGLINNAWGGSACEAWIRRDLLEQDEQYKPLLDRWAELEKRAAATPEDRNLQAQMKGNARPGNIYNGALKPTIGFGIRGVIWYQGESNAGRAYQYRAMFPLLIQSWRDEWGQGDFPFYWVQLADFMAEKPEPGESAWAELREAQTMTMDRLPKTGEAVIIDLGEGRDIHPRNKQRVAKRLARWALAEVYGKDVPHRSPRYQSVEKKDGRMVVKFVHVGQGLYSFDVDEPRGFAIAGSDRKWYAAQAKITGPDTVEVWSEAVPDPVAVRYAWADNPVCNLYGKIPGDADGLPVTPFRTDDWKGVTAEAR
ncbi:MAG: 9-O-acetylesterase [Isosphaeraceae bacterium]|jgi:sialate O-acetylesterase|nr:MAG: 9-O-acetylesterase [Isosphaeraceae bacterium]